MKRTPKSIKSSKLRLKLSNSFKNCDLSLLVRLVSSNDTNYIIGLIVALISARVLHLKANDGFYLDKKSRKHLIIMNTFLLLSILVIFSYNNTLGIILSILLLSINM